MHFWGNTDCMPDKPRYDKTSSLRYILVMMMMLMILHYPTRYLYPPLDPARPPTAVAWDDQGASLLRTAIRPEKRKGRCRNWSEKPCDSWYGLWRSRWRDEIVFLCGSCRRTDPATSDCSARIAQARKVWQGCRLTLHSCHLAVLINYVKQTIKDPLWKGLVFFSRTNLVRSFGKVISCMESVLLEDAESSLGLRLERKLWGIDSGERLKINLFLIIAWIG